MAVTISGRVRFRRSGSPATSRGWSRKRSPRYASSPRTSRWIRTPHEPSSTTIRSRRRASSLSRAVASHQDASSRTHDRSPTENRWHNGCMRLTRVVLGLLAALALATSAALGSGGPGDDNTAFGYGKNVHFARTLGFCNIYHGNALRTCLTNRLVGLVVASHDSAHELPRIDEYVAKAGGFLQANCHGLMHGVGRRYAAAVHVTVGRLLEYLPRTN